MIHSIRITHTFLQATRILTVPLQICVFAVRFRKAVARLSLETELIKA